MAGKGKSKAAAGASNEVTGTVLIVGGCGFLGRHIVEYILVRICLSFFSCFIFSWTGLEINQTLPLVINTEQISSLESSCESPGPSPSCRSHLPTRQTRIRTRFDAFGLSLFDYSYLTSQICFVNVELKSTEYYVNNAVCFSLNRYVLIENRWHLSSGRCRTSMQRSQNCHSYRISPSRLG